MGFDLALLKWYKLTDKFEIDIIGNGGRHTYHREYGDVTSWDSVLQISKLALAEVNLKLGSLVEEENNNEERVTTYKLT